MNTLATVFIFLRRMTYITLGRFDQAVLRAHNPVFILSYHSIANDNWRFSVNEKDVKKQITYLHKHFEIITLKQLTSYFKGKEIITKPSVVLTFDDGYKDILKLKSFFTKLGITPALFVLSDTKHPNTAEMKTKREFLTISEIKTLKKAGWEIGSHSATHPNLTTISEQQQTDEIVNAKKDLEKKLGFSITYFAYPRGKYDTNVVRLVKKAKYQLGLTMDDGIINKKSEVLLLPRVGIDRTHSFSEFKHTFSPSVVKFRTVIKKSPAGRYL